MCTYLSVCVYSFFCIHITSLCQSLYIHDQNVSLGFSLIYYNEIFNFLHGAERSACERKLIGDLNNNLAKLLTGFCCCGNDHL